MSYIICSTAPALKPYNIKGLGISIYSIEELCYYIYNNIFDINEGFVNDELLDFLSNELKEGILAQRLRDMQKMGKKEYEQLILIVSYSDYLSANELLDFKTSIQRLSGCKKLQRYKLKADSLFKKGRIEKAVSIYNLIINDEDFLQGSDIFKSSIYHNLAGGYAYSFHYKKAFNNYYKAYRYQKDDRNLFACLMALYMDIQETDEFMKQAISYGFSVSKVASVEELINNSFNNFSNNYKSIEKIVEETRTAMS